MGKDKQQAQQAGPQKPSIARNVHYVDSAKHRTHYAAIITTVNEVVDTVNLVVFDTAIGVRMLSNVSFDEAGGAGTWHWPERA